MRRLRRILWCGVCAGLIGMAGGRLSMAYQQRNAPPPPVQTPMSTNQWPGMRGTDARLNETPVEDGLRRQMETKRMKLVSSERQKMMVKEADEIVQMSADLQASLAKEQQGAAREEALRHVDTIEKLARNVKERMKGDR